MDVLDAYVLSNLGALAFFLSAIGTVAFTFFAYWPVYVGRNQCRRCGYSLDRSSKTNCPECGRASTSRKLFIVRFPRFLVIAVIMGLHVVAYSVILVSGYWGEQQAQYALDFKYSDFYEELDELTWVGYVMLGPLHKPFERTTEVKLGSVIVSTEEVEFIAVFRGLRKLKLSNIEVRNDSDREFEFHFSRLKVLELYSMHVDDDFVLALIGEGRYLENIEIHGAYITDRTVRAIKRLPRLRYLRISQTFVTPDAIAELKTARPNVTVEYIRWEGKPYMRAPDTRLEGDARRQK